MHNNCFSSQLSLWIYKSRSGWRTCKFVKQFEVHRLCSYQSLRLRQRRRQWDQPWKLRVSQRAKWQQQQQSPVQSYFLLLLLLLLLRLFPLTVNGANLCAPPNGSALRGSFAVTAYMTVQISRTSKIALVNIFNHLPYKEHFLCVCCWSPSNVFGFEFYQRDVVRRLRLEAEEIE